MATNMLNENLFHELTVLCYIEEFGGNRGFGQPRVQNESLKYTDQLLQTSKAPN